MAGVNILFASLPLTYFVEPSMDSIACGYPSLLPTSGTGLAIETEERFTGGSLAAEVIVQHVVELRGVFFFSNCLLLDTTTADTRRLSSFFQLLSHFPFCLTCRKRSASRLYS